MRKALLACGALASLLYAATDVLGGLRYPWYDFGSRAISELMATGAPSEVFVDPLFLAYGVLALVFGVGVLWEGAGRSRALWITSALLIGYAAAGFTGPTLFEMDQRGAGSLAGDAPHIVVTGVLVLLLLLAIGMGGLALGRRFRVYSLATLVTVIVFGAPHNSVRRSTRRGRAHPGLRDRRAHQRLRLAPLDGRAGRGARPAAGVPGSLWT